MVPYALNAKIDRTGRLSRPQRSNVMDATAQTRSRKIRNDDEYACGVIRHFHGKLEELHGITGTRR